MKRYTIIFGSMFVFLFLAGCAASGSLVGATPTAAPAVQADCFQSATALAWLDEDGDGVWDEGERPLPGIEFVLEPTVYSRTTSDENGVAKIFATTPGGCLDNLDLQVIAAKFDGYTLTTPRTLPYEAPDAEYMFGFQPESSGTLVETETYTGAIFPAAAAAEYAVWFSQSADGFWTPDAEDVANFEAGLAAFLQNSDAEHADMNRIVSRLPDYTRQYFGFTQAGERIMLVNFFCKAEIFDWMETAVFVEDGGDCYFQVVYNADTGDYLALYVNGES